VIDAYSVHCSSLTPARFHLRGVETRGNVHAGRQPSSTFFGRRPDGGAFDLAESATKVMIHQESPIIKVPASRNPAERTPPIPPRGIKF
jgi:hypothetical protein